MSRPRIRTHGKRIRSDDDDILTTVQRLSDRDSVESVGVADSVAQLYLPGLDLYLAGRSANDEPAASPTRGPRFATTSSPGGNLVVYGVGDDFAALPETRCVAGYSIATFGRRSCLDRMARTARNRRHGLDLAELSNADQRRAVLQPSVVSSLKKRIM